MDLARSVQEITEEVMLKMARFAHRETGARDLCLAGGVALNCVGNGRLLREGPFEQIWIQPAAGDAGGAVGVALSLWHRFLQQPRASAEAIGTLGTFAAGCSHSALCGRDERVVPRPSILRRGDRVVPGRQRLQGAPRRAGRRWPTKSPLCSRSEKVVGLLQGRMEFGPRALGARSILGDARSTQMQSVMNLKIKFRESFRPFAPAVLREHVADWFELDTDSPYMLLVAGCAEGSPAAVAGRAAHTRRDQPAAIDGAGDYACRLLGAHSDRARARPTRCSTTSWRRFTGAPSVRCS